MSATHPRVRTGRLARTATTLIAATALTAGGILATAGSAAAATPVVAACAQLDPNHLSVSVDGPTGLAGLANVATVTLTDTGTGTVLGTYPSVSLLNGLINLSLPNLALPTGLTNVTNIGYTIDPVPLLSGVLTPIVGSTPCLAAPIQPLTGSYETLTPARILDTRTGLGGSLKVPAQSTITLTVAGQGGVPATTGLLDGFNLPLPGTAPSAVNLNLTVGNATAPGYLTVYPAGSTQPATSNLNFLAGQTIANTTIAQLGTGGAIKIYNSSLKPVDIIGDVSGYYNTGALTPIVSLTPGAYQPITPVRLLDTRTSGGSAKLQPQTSLSFDATSGLGTLPLVGIDSVVLNVTSTNTSARGHLRVWPDGTTMPNASNLNFGSGNTIANEVVVKPGANGKVDIFNGSLASTADVVVDVIGYIAGGLLPVQTPGLQSAVTPFRLLDTRYGTGGAKAKVAAGGTRKVQVIGVDGVPALARAAVITVTATEEGTLGFATVYPGPTRPTASILNFVKLTDVANVMIAPINADGSITIYNGSTAATDLVIDLSAYITGATASVG